MKTHHTTYAEALKRLNHPDTEHDYAIKSDQWSTYFTGTQQKAQENFIRWCTSGNHVGETIRLYRNGIAIMSATGQ